MPIYEYHCPTCNHKFDKLQPMNAAGADCPVCEQPARRAISVFAAISAGAAAGSGEFNSMSLPSLPGGGCCGGGCGCGH